MATFSISSLIHTNLNWTLKSVTWIISLSSKMVPWNLSFCTIKIYNENIPHRLENFTYLPRIFIFLSDARSTSRDYVPKLTILYIKVNVCCMLCVECLICILSSIQHCPTTFGNGVEHSRKLGVGYVWSRFSKRDSQNKASKYFLSVIQYWKFDIKFETNSIKLE